MFQSRRIVVTMATVATLVAVPATASAKSPKVSASAGVQVHVVKAKKAIKLLKKAAKADNNAVVISQLRIARSQVAAASKLARRMAKSADPVAAAASLTLVGTSYDQLLGSVTGIVDDVTGQAQTMLAQSINPTLAGNAQVLSVLTSLLDDVPASVQPLLASIVGSLGVSSGNDIVTMATALASGALPVDINALLTQSIHAATAAIQGSFATITSIMPLMSSTVQGPLSQILATVTQVGSAGSILPSVLNSASALSTITGLISTVLGALPVAGGVAGAGGLTSTLTGLLGGITGAGGGVLPGNLGATLSSLLGGITGGGAGSIPGVGGVLSTVTGLINSLLGGLLGGLGTATA
ncbi:MAG: hypothetical protein QOD83_3787 [Solirubrobacteraceae bacterium]|nr:hypothetical protein [Solirubrobacteraceae bacterium]